MECGGCTACCTMFPIEQIGKPANTQCPNCDAGCKIYDSKPQTCNEYECAYYQVENAPESLRPDRCGVIFTKKTDRIFSGVLVTGTPVTDAAKSQIQSFNAQGFSVILLSATKSQPYQMLAPGHDAEVIMSEYKEGLRGHL